MTRPLPILGDLLFSAKTFAAAMLALYVAFRLDLPRPYWAMATVYIVSNPLAGAMRSKAVFRVCGTALGAAAAVALVPNLAAAPELLSLALVLWIGLCLYFALLDRTPRGYLFMLAGYSAAIIGFPSVADPGAIFDTALARVEEITLGIVCATTVGSIVFPRTVGPVLTARIDAWLRDAARWTEDALAGRRDDEASLADRRRLAADAVEVGMLTTHLAYDVSNAAGAVRAVRALRQRMVLLLPALSSVADRVEALRRAGALAPPVAALLGEIGAWMRAGTEASRAEALRLRAATQRLEPAIDERASWNDIVLTTLLARLRETVGLLQQCRDLRQHIVAGAPLPARLRRDAAAGTALHRDRGMAVLSAVAAAAAILLVDAFWIASGWPDGAVACQMAAIACCLFAAQDNPVPAMISFQTFNAVGFLVAAVYVVGVLPAIDGFPMLALVLAPTFLPLGVGLARPAWYGRALAVAAGAPTLMALQSRYNVDIAGFLNSGLAQIVGMTTAALVVRLLRSVGADWSARRLLRAGWAELAALAAGPAAERGAFVARMADRIGLLLPRLAATAPGAELAAVDALRDVRVGLNILELQRRTDVLPPSPRRAIDLLLRTLMRHFDARAGRASTVPADTLLRRIDRALGRAATAPPTPARRHALLALAGIRRGLFPDAPPALPAPSPPDWREAA